MMSLIRKNPIDQDVEKATSEKYTKEEWSHIMEICDKIQANHSSSKEYFKAIMKRLNHQDPHIVMQAITLLDACVNNCGICFHLEIASREFEIEFCKLLSRSQPKICEKLKSLLKNWAEGSFKDNTQLMLIPTLYKKLRDEGIDFSQTDKLETKQSSIPKDPNVASTQQEVEEIAKAIELSLKETTLSPKSKGGSSRGSSSLYPSVKATVASETRKVRALYDFEAAEENELTFQAGEIITVIDDSDPNWWNGSNHRGEGLFPSNFVTADLSVEPEKRKIEKKCVQFNEECAVRTVKYLQPIQIDELKIDRLLYLLHEADPNDDTNDTEEMISLEEEVNAMGPLIDTELERVDRKHAQLTQLSSSLVEALNLYHTLMREPFQVAKPLPQFQPHVAPSQIYNGPAQFSLPPEQYMMGGPGYPMNLPRHEESGPQSMPPHVSSSHPMASYPPSNLQNYGVPSLPSFPVGIPENHGYLPASSSFTESSSTTSNGK